MIPSVDVFVVVVDVFPFRFSLRFLLTLGPEFTQLLPAVNQLLFGVLDDEDDVHFGDICYEHRGRKVIFPRLVLTRNFSVSRSNSAIAEAFLGDLESNFGTIATMSIFKRAFSWTRVSR